MTAKNGESFIVDGQKYILVAGNLRGFRCHFKDLESLLSNAEWIEETSRDGSLFLQMGRIPGGI